MNPKLKIIMIFFVMAIPFGLKVLQSQMKAQQLIQLSEAIKSKQICNSTENVMECAHQQLLSVSNRSVDPIHGQQFFSEIVKTEIERNPERGRFLKDQYFIFTADLYLRSLEQRQKSFLGRFPILNQQNIDVQVATAFLKGMTDYSNRREVDRTIASETILQEVSNFNSSMERLRQALMTK